MHILFFANIELSYNAKKKTSGSCSSDVFREKASTKFSRTVVQSSPGLRYCKCGIDIRCSFCDALKYFLSNDAIFNFNSALFTFSFFELNSVFSDSAEFFNFNHPCSRRLVVDSLLSKTTPTHTPHAYRAPPSIWTRESSSAA